MLQLVDISDEIRRARKQRAREIEWEREYQEDWDRSRHRSWGGGPRWEEVVERDLVYEGRAPPRGYLRLRECSVVIPLALSGMRGMIMVP